MGKPLRKAQARLKARRDAHQGTKRDGRPAPGSMNAHKAFAGRRRKKRY